MELDSNILKKLTIRTIDYLKQDLGMNDINNSFNIEKVDSIKYKELTSFISLSMDIKGTFFISVNNAISKEMVKNFIYGEVSEDVIDELSSENLSETLNVVVGNILSEIEIIKNGGNVDMSTPTLVEDNSILIDKIYDKLYICKIIYKNEEIILGYFI